MTASKKTNPVAADHGAQAGASNRTTDDAYNISHPGADAKGKITPSEVRSKVEDRIEQERAWYAPGQTDEADDIDVRPWPVLADAALRGIAGEFVGLACRASEADPAAVLMTFLVRAGVEFGAMPHLVVGDQRHPARLMAVIVGASSKARKGTSAAPVTRLFRLGRAGDDDTYIPARTSPGPLSSGEGLIYAVRDEVREWRINKKSESGMWVVVDPGVTDKRLFVLDEELAGALASTRREGNTLSTIIRCAFDSGTLEPLTKSSRIKATGAHIGIVSHVTVAELHKLLDDTQSLNGFANRFLWVCARRQGLVPFPEPMPTGEVMRLQLEIIRLIHNAPAGEVALTPRCRDMWASVYPDVSQDHPGLVGCIVNRGEALTLRLALLYSFLDGAGAIDVEHMGSALAVWDYCRESAEFIFGGREQNPIAQKILEALRDAPDHRMTLTGVNDAFGRHADTGKIQGALSDLLAARKIEIGKTPGRGRPQTIVTLMVAKKAKKAN